MKAEVLRPGVQAVGHNWRPFLLIQVCAVGLVALYYTNPGFQSLAASLGHLKVSGGYAFSILSTAIAGAVLPEVAKRLTGSAKPVRFGEAVFQLVYFGWIGFFVDAQYRTLGVLLGNAPNFSTIAAKVFIDQFLLSPFVTMPMSISIFLWHDGGFTLEGLRRRVRDGTYRSRYWPLLVTCWAYWIPVVSAVYAMPGDLQFVLFLCTQAAWAILLLHINGRE